MVRRLGLTGRRLADARLRAHPPMLECRPEETRCAPWSSMVARWRSQNRPCAPRTPAAPDGCSDARGAGLLACKRADRAHTARTGAVPFVRGWLAPELPLQVRAPDPDLAANG